MKLDKRAQLFVDKKLQAMGHNPKANPDPQSVYQILIEGYWTGHLDMDPDAGEIILNDKPVTRHATPAEAHISGAIMQAMLGGEKSKRYQVVRVRKKFASIWHIRARSAILLYNSTIRKVGKWQASETSH